MKKGEIILCFCIALILVVPIFYELNKKNNTQRQKLDLSIDIGKLLFINTVLENKNKTSKQIDSIYEIRKDSILDRVESTH